MFYTSVSTFPTLSCSSSTVNMAGDVTMSGNKGRYSGGAIFNEGSVTMPLSAYISGNSAIVVSNFVSRDIPVSIFSWISEPGAKCVESAYH